MEKLPQISEAEYEIMKIIWADSPISTNEVCEKAPKAHNWSNKTIHTLLSRLVAKHVISYEQRGRMYYYYPIISSARAFQVLWKRAYNRFVEYLGGVVYEDPWLAGGHNGLSNAEDPTNAVPLAPVQSSVPYG